LVITVLLIAPFLILLFAFPSAAVWPWIVPVVALIAAAALLLNKEVNQKLITLSLSAIIGLNIFLSSWFYPSILKYQAGNRAGRYVTEQNIPRDKFFIYKFSGNGTALHFYSKRIVKGLNDLETVSSGMYLLTMEEGLEDLVKKNKQFEVVQEGLDYHITALTGKFLNKDTRDAQCKKYYVVKLL
jgi:hypothetical protein